MIINEFNNKNMSEKTSSQESITCSNSSRNVSFSESLLQDINYFKNKNIVIITKNFEQRIPDILAFLQNNLNLAIHKIQIVKYLQNLFLSISINSEIFLRKLSSEKEKLNLYQIIIEEYIYYTNSSNFQNDEIDYRNELLSLFDILLSQVTMDRESYHHILSFLLRFINEKNNKFDLGLTPTPNISDGETQKEEIHLTDKHLTRILTLLQRFYQFLDDIKLSMNYFFFSGDPETSIIIHNKNSVKDNKKLLTLEDNLCVLMFIKLFPSEHIKAAGCPQTNSKLIELKFNEKNKDKDISIELNMDNNLWTNFTIGPLVKLSENTTNWLLVKFKKKKRIKVKMYLNGNKIKYNNKDRDKEKDKDKEEIKEIILFKNFIGICYNFMIFKTKKKKEILPKFLENELLKNNQRDKGSIFFHSDSKKQNALPKIKTNYYNGFISEDLLFPFIKTEFKDEIDQNTLNELFIEEHPNNNSGEIKDLIEKMIAIYMPKRVVIPPIYNKNILNNSPKLILVDSLNGLDAEFITKNPGLNGVHIFKKMIDDFGPIGGLNNLLPILEIMTRYKQLLTKENLGNFFDLLISIFIPQYQKALIKEKDSNFFLYLSYFFEKIPEDLYDNSLTGIFKSISSFLTTQINENDNFIEFTEQFHINILMNEKILFKFHHEEQKEIINIITNLLKNIDSKTFNIDIIKIINILLHLDQKKNNLFCCKKHSEYFTEQYDIMNPELYIRLQPIEELLNYLFEEFEEKVSTNDPLAVEAGDNLSKLFTLLTFDISPCIQKMIIRLFSRFLENHFNDRFDKLNREEQILNISLFILKTSIFDIKEDILYFIFIILQNGRKNINKNESKDLLILNEGECSFISNNILPFYLFEDNELIQISKNIKDEEEYVETPKLIRSNSQEFMHKEGIGNLEEKEKKDLLNEYATNTENIALIEEYFEKHQEKEENTNKLLVKKDSKRELDIYNEMYQEDDVNNSISKLNGIKVNSKINDVIYALPKLNDNLIKIHSIYNKKKLDILINDLFNIIYKYFHEGIAVRLSLNLLTKIVSKGNLLLVLKFLNNLLEETNNIFDYKKIVDEIYDNQNLLQWLIETCFQSILIKESNLDHTIFVPGFDINVSRIDNKGNDVILNDKEKMEIINDIIKISKSLLNNIFNRNIYKMDYIFTWSKYFYELRNETNNFKSVRQLILDFMLDIGYNYCKDCTNPDISNNHEQKMTVYFFNLLFEFVTFYKLKQEDLEEYQDESTIYQELPKNLKHILVSKMDDTRDTLRPIDVQENIDSKFIEYPFFKTVFDFWTPLWKGENQDNRLRENDIYGKFINNKKNININELELLFYNFKDIQLFKDDSKNNIYVNKGIPLIFIIYHFFTLIFSIGGNQVELRELFTEFRLFILLLIISSSTLSTPRIGQKRKWPSDEQYKNVQLTIEAILFNFLYFLFNKIKSTKEKINDFNEKEQYLEEEEQKYLNYLKQINKLLIENLGYFLKILNKIYREIKKEDDKNNAGLGAVGGFFKGIKYLFFEYEGVKKSGGFKVIEKMYSECPNLSSNNNNKNYLDEITDINFNDKEFLINTKTNVNSLEIKIGKQYINLEKNINSFIEDSEIGQFFEKHSEEYKKLLFPFVSYILSRREAIKNIIPVYDNRPNLRFYQKEFFLLPDYFPRIEFESTILKHIESVNNGLNEGLKLNQTKMEIEQHHKRHNYKKEKQKLFSFTGIWSNKDYFYNKKKFRLKYRLLNHMSEDFTRVLLTPIIDVDYYLPQFGKFRTENLFRKMPNYKSVYKATDLSFDINKISPLDKDEKKVKKDNKKKFEDKENKENKENKDLISTNLKPSTSNDLAETSNKISSLKDISEGNNNTINENKNDKDKNALYYIGIENFSFIKEKDKKEENIHEYLFRSFIQKKHNVIQDNYCIQINACLVRLAFHIKGIIFNNKEGIGFYSFETKRKENEENYDSDRKVCFGSVFRPQTAKYNHYFISIPYNKIQYILRRRYFFKKSALEIFTEDKKSYLFNIEGDLNNIKYFIENIKYFMKQDLEDIFIEYNKFDEKIGFVNKKNIFLNTNLQLFTNKKNSMNLKLLYEKWSKWEISTLQMLMIMNIYSNRTYNDINQYPVFPWIITDYTSPTIPHFEKEFFIRPMNKPMGMLDFTAEARERKENYEEHWSSNENDEDRDDNYDRYGSHYSTSLYLTYYLVRVFPYSYIRIELQGKNFDDPNRLFNSLPNSFDCAITQKSDLRELIPEFFCFPEMFLNMNELNLGEINDEKGNHKLVGGVEMPTWANNSVYTFIEKHRELLESAEINEKINEWFNIIFGNKQKGKEAKKIGNLFIKQTYEDFDEIYNKSSKSEKIYQCRMVEFGVTPNQIFKGDANKRQNISDCNKIKRKLLFHILQKKNKKIELSGKEWDLEEKLNIEENIHKMFIFLVKKKDRKKERLYLLTNNKVKVYTKYDKNQLFKSAASKEKAKGKEYDGDMNLGDILGEEDEIKDDNDNEMLSNSLPNIEKQKDSDEKLTIKEQSKMNIYAKYDKKFLVPKYRMRFSESPNLLYDEGFHIAFGGFWNGDIILRQLIEFKADTKKSKYKKLNIIKTGELSPIIKILTDITETIAICYNAEGTIFIYIIDQNDKLTWHIHKIINEGQGEISSLALNENLDIFIACFKNGYCMTYTLPNCKLYNSFRIEEYELNKSINKDNNLSSSQIESLESISFSNKIYSPDICFISQSPLPCFIFYIKERKSLCVYSINAHFLNEFYLGYEIVENGIQKYTDNFFKDHLFIFNSLNNTIDVHELTDLKLIFSSPIINYQFVDFQFTKELDYAFILVKVKQKNEDKSPTHKILVLKQSLNDMASR